ncbi:MAG: hypothetical protein ACX94A_11065 [Algiphilus sp.]
MKIIRTRQTEEGFPVSDVIGLRCDNCGHEARHNLDATESQVCIAASMEVGDFKRIDIDFGSSLNRADLCARCFDVMMGCMRQHLDAFRYVASPDPTRRYHREHRFEVLSAESGRKYEIRSMFDEDLHLSTLGG